VTEVAFPEFALKLDEGIMFSELYLYKLYTTPASRLETVTVNVSLTAVGLDSEPSDICGFS